MTAEVLLNQLHKVRKTGDGKWIACCPSHPDKTPSLSIKETSDGHVLIHCFAGCDPVDILSMTGLTMSDLFPDRDQYSIDDRPPSWNQPVRTTRCEDDITSAQVRVIIAEQMAEDGEQLSSSDQAKALTDFKYLKSIGRLP